MPTLTRRQLGHVLLIGLPPIVVFLAVVVPLTIDGPNGIWAQHPFITGLLTGFLTLAATIVIVNRLIEARADQRWRSVALVAYRGLARESRDVSTQLAALYCDADHYCGPLPTGGSQGHTRDLEPLYEIRNPIAGKDKLPVFESSSLPTEVPDDQDVVPVARMQLLLHDATWCKFAHDHVADLATRQIDLVAKWAPLMLSAAEPREFVDAFASLQSELFALAVALLRCANSPDDEPSIAAALHLWRVVDGKARIITNCLWAYSERGIFSLKLPSALRQMTIGSVIEQPGRLGTWQKLDEVSDEALLDPFYKPGAKVRAASA